MQKAEENLQKNKIQTENKKPGEMHGLGQGSLSIVGYNYGAKNAGRVKET